MTRRTPESIVKLKLGASVCLLSALLLAGCGSSSTPSGRAASNGSTSVGSAGLGTTIHLPVPAALRHLPMTNQHGQSVELASWPGKTVLLVPFLTLCQDICPLTTGNLLQVEQSLTADHAAPKDAAPDFQHLTHPPQPDWTPADALPALSVSVGTPLPISRG